ncbi:MAG: hypothetical protein Q8Q35_00585 [Nanoarchaeota archaeon]|nr:hypothetical protein [Nanoarchaeota archaeon]
MDFDQGEDFNHIGETLGFIFSYFVFTTILFTLFYYLDKLPSGWTYYHIMTLTLFIVFIGFFIQEKLK